MAGLRGTRAGAAALALVGAAALARAAAVLEAEPVTDRVVCVHVADGRAVPAGWADGIQEDPLHPARATRAAGWTVADESGATPPAHPLRIGRKSKGRDFVIVTRPAWKPVWTMEHWLYLVLPRPLSPGSRYRITGPGVSATLAFDPLRTRSAAVHVNQLGYDPAAPRRTAYVSAWLGDLGPLAFDDRRGAAFHLVDARLGTTVFAGTLAPRRRAADGAEDARPGVGSLVRADTWECDFSAFRGTGTFVLAVDGVGASFPFRIAPDAYAPAFRAVLRGLYQQRCGVALTEPFTAWTRSACHRPEDRPVIRSAIRRMDRQCDACPDPEPTGVRVFPWGGYHDAGDWDREPGHPEIPGVLAFAYELFPGRLAADDLDLPGSGNGLPDLLDEAVWALESSLRLQDPDGGVSVGMFLGAFPQPGVAAAADSASRYEYAPEPQASYRFAASACHVARALALAGRPEAGTAYVDAARRAWDWAETHQRPGDAGLVRDDRLYAAASLFASTGAAVYHDAFRRDLRIDTAATPLWVWQSHDQQWAVWTYAVCDRPETDPALRDRLRAASAAFARAQIVRTAARRAYRFGLNEWRPLTWGALAVPQTLPAVVAFALTGASEFADAMHTGCDFTLGGNPLDTCWITGTGARPAEGVFHPDSWTGPHPEAVCPGIVPEGPYEYAGPPAAHSGPWDPAFVQATAYPPAKDWPALELYFAARQCFPMNEFTVRQMAEAVLCYGALAAVGGAAAAPTP